MGGGGVTWIDLPQDRGQVAGPCQCGNVPLVAMLYIYTHTLIYLHDEYFE